MSHSPFEKSVQLEKPVAPSDMSRRSFVTNTLGAAAALGTLGLSMDLWAQNPDRYQPGAAPVRYPEPDVIALDKRFKYKLGNAPIERLHTGMLWCEGPAWNGVGRYLVWSDIPNNEQLRWLEENSQVSRQFRFPSNNSNGNTFDYQGRQISCEHLTRRVVRYEFNGKVTVLADSYNGKSFNAPNDVVVHPDGGIWFTDPGYGSLGNYEGDDSGIKSPQPFQKEAIYRIDPQGKLTQVADDIYKPNGLCFSADYKILYAAESGSSHYPEAKRSIRMWDVVNENSLKNGRLFTEMKYNDKNGGTDGLRSDVDGNIWASGGWAGEGFDGVHIFAPNGDRIGHIRLPESCSNLCFGGTKRNRLFMTASRSLYSVYVGTKGAHIA
jgi:gluconolactonase